MKDSLMEARDTDNNGDDDVYNIRKDYQWIMMERDTGHPRGFGFLTFADRWGMEDAIREMHLRELGDRVISVNRARPKMGGEDPDHGYVGGYSSGGRGSYGGGDSPDDKYGSCDRYVIDRYPSSGDRFAGDRYGGLDRYHQNGYGKDREYDRDERPRGSGNRYGGGPARYEGRSYGNRRCPTLMMMTSFGLNPKWRYRGRIKMSR
ncbi:hypothetical protein F0562_025948 [Nyssa sinensis]|uniref:RRM domain-containing protein n=1 Tax=Nyssa sinensis TaxID=561372 RepID=A0A5J5BA37_9ASTE|nr:hypothetical protein F0562_025948 [Nyssa sinensis]